MNSFHVFYKYVLYFDKTWTVDDVLPEENKSYCCFNPAHSQGWHQSCRNALRRQRFGRGGGAGGGEALFVINGCPTKALFTRSVPAPLGGTTGVGALYDLAICCCSACPLSVWLCAMMIPQLHYDNLDTIFLERKKCVGVRSPLTKHPGVLRGWGWRWSAPPLLWFGKFWLLFACQLRYWSCMIMIIPNHIIAIISIIVLIQFVFEKGINLSITPTPPPQPNTLVLLRRVEVVCPLLYNLANFCCCFDCQVRGQSGMMMIIQQPIYDHFDTTFLRKEKMGRSAPTHNQTFWRCPRPSTLLEEFNWQN